MYLINWVMQEVHVDVVRAVQKVAHHFVRVLEGKRQQAHRGRHAVTPADPVPELKHVLLVDAELGDLFGVGGDGAHVVGDDFFVGGFAAICEGSEESRTPASPEAIVAASGR